MSSEFEKALLKQQYGKGVKNVTGSVVNPKDADRISAQAAKHAKEAARIRKFKDTPHSAIMKHLNKAAELEKKAAKLRNSKWNVPY